MLTQQNLHLQYLVFFGLPLLAMCFGGLYAVARIRNHPSRVPLAVMAIVTGIPGFLAFAYWLFLVLLFSSRGSYGAPAG